MKRTDYIDDFLRYSRWLILGWSIGLVVGVLFDHYFSFGNPILEGVTRFITGAGDTIGASIGNVVYRLKYKRRSKAETFLIGTMIGSLAGPLVQFTMLSLGINTAGVTGAIMVVAYSNSDNWGGVLSSFAAEVKRHKKISAALTELSKNVFIVVTVLVLTSFALLDVLIRAHGFAPDSYFLSAMEGALINNDSTIAVLIFFIYTRYKK